LFVVISRPVTGYEDRRLQHGDRRGVMSWGETIAQSTFLGRKVMASEDVPSPPAAPTQPWFARSGLSGKLLAIGGLAGIVSAFLPLVSLSVAVQGPGGDNPFGMFGGVKIDGNQLAMGIHNTAKVVDNWRGKAGLAGYLAAVVFAFVLYPPQGLGQKALAWAGVGIGLAVLVLAIWLLVLALDSGNVNLMGLVIGNATVGIGAYINVVAGALAAAGGFLKAREEKLI
jgi:hypothetical protein